MYLYIQKFCIICLHDPQIQLISCMTSMLLYIHIMGGYRRISFRIDAHDHNLITLSLFVYRMDLRSTKLSQIENFRVFRVFIFADARPTILY